VVAIRVLIAALGVNGDGTILHATFFQKKAYFQGVRRSIEKEFDF
jgi:hypothetical protein